jgi:LL-diaminopimelate aminotransferase
MKINENYKNLNESYLFSAVSKKVREYKTKNPKADIISLGIGDVTMPICPHVIDAMITATYDMGAKKTFHGYGDEQGYTFLRDAISAHYKTKRVTIAQNEIFVGDGAKSDLGNILDIFAPENIVLVPNPVYPVYVDTNIMAGRKIIYANGTKENNFLPMPDENTHADIIYLCSPNNPTGAVYTREQLKTWVDYAIKHNAVILFDSAYEAFVRDKTLPTSIFQIPNAKKCAIEFCSLSKTAGFTGIRCGYTVIPNDLEFGGTKLNALWLRRQTTKFNGVSYIVQRGAAAVFNNFSPLKAQISQYMRNSRIISKTLSTLKIWHTGGVNAPYIWLKCPNGKSSWEFFDFMLEKLQIVGTPGIGFGVDGYFRFTAFATRENTLRAMKRLKKYLDNKTQNNA